VLAAIALPSLLSQVSKARQSEAKQNVGSLNRAQQAYYLENANKFAKSLSELAIGIKEKTDNYEYKIDLGAGGKEGTAAANVAAARQPKLKSYAGITYSKTEKVGGVDESLTQASLCEAETPNAGAVDTAQAITVPDISSGDCAKFTTPKMKAVK
jgi:type IV pilus assembly protein PilA